MQHLVLIVCAFSLVTGCSSRIESYGDDYGDEPTTELERTEVISSPSLPQSPAIPPVTIEASFPHDAPPLNEEAELIFIFKTLRDFNNVTIEVRLPESLELINGDLSWVGDVSAGNELKVIDIIVRAVKIGNWGVELRKSMSPEKQSNLYFYPDWQTVVYVSISENSAEWRLRPPYRDASPLPPGTIGVAPPGEDTSNLPLPPATSPNNPSSP